MRFQPGVLTGDQVTELLNDAKDRGYAIPVRMSLAPIVLMQF